MTAARPTVRPPDRSAEPEMMTNIHPRATTMRVELWVRISRRTRRDKNFGEIQAITTIISTIIRCRAWFIIKDFRLNEFFSFSISAFLLTYTAAAS